jgi:quinol monooxygenase YgiN
MKHNHPIQRVVSYEIKKNTKENFIQFHNSFWEIFFENFNNNGQLSKHVKLDHSSAFQECLTKYYSLATFITEPNFQKVWNSTECPNIDLEKFKVC